MARQKEGDFVVNKQDFDLNGIFTHLNYVIVNKQNSLNNEKFHTCNSDLIFILLSF
jgi:hypothetical protein